LVCEIIFFPKFCSLLLVFLFFSYFWHFIFNFVYLYFSKNCRNFYVFLLYGLNILSKNFGKSWNIFLTNIDIWNSKFFKNYIVYYLFSFYFFSILVIFFSISPIQTCQKILNIFLVLYCMDYRFYQRILGNSWTFTEKNRDTLNTKQFQNFIVYYLLFLFFSIFYMFFF